MQFFQVHQGLLSVSIAMITISLTAGLNCSKCVDVRNVQVLKNTVSGFPFTVDPANRPTSHLCESVKNGEVAAGVSVVECPKIHQITQVVQVCSLQRNARYVTYLGPGKHIGRNQSPL